jgi:hypothetical protein
MNSWWEKWWGKEQGKEETGDERWGGGETAAA